MRTGSKSLSSEDDKAAGQGVSGMQEPVYEIECTPFLKQTRVCAQRSLLLTPFVLCPYSALTTAFIVI
jgi:hypothetical protein